MSLNGRVVVGVTPAFDEGVKLPVQQRSFYLRREYTRMIYEAGAVPIIITPDMHIADIMHVCDALVISGGEDIPAEVYGGEKLLTVPEPLERIMWERLLIDECERRRKPLLGVCYGMQLLALHYGGKLYQDIGTSIAGSMNHCGTIHEVTITRDFLGFSAGNRTQVNSRHHQAVATPPESFSVCAVAPDGVIEALNKDSMFGVQWHPESDDTGISIYKALIAQCS